jgi:hypothetical protein
MVRYFNILFNEVALPDLSPPQEDQNTNLTHRWVTECPLWQEKRLEHNHWYFPLWFPLYWNWSCLLIWLSKTCGSSNDPMSGWMLSVLHTFYASQTDFSNVVCLFLSLFVKLSLSHDKSVGIALGYGLDDQGSRVRFPVGAGNFSLHHRVQNGLGFTRPPIQWVPGAPSLGGKADHSPPSSAEVKEWVELYLHPQYAFMVWCLVKHRDNFTFYLPLCLTTNPRSRRREWR